MNHASWEKSINTHIIFALLFYQIVSLDKASFVMWKVLLSQNNLPTAQAINVHQKIIISIISISFINEEPLLVPIIWDCWLLLAQRVQEYIIQHFLSQTWFFNWQLRGLRGDSKLKNPEALKLQLIPHFLSKTHEICRCKWWWRSPGWRWAPGFGRTIFFLLQRWCHVNTWQQLRTWLIERGNIFPDCDCDLNKKSKRTLGLSEAWKETCNFKEQSWDFPFYKQQEAYFMRTFSRLFLKSD